MHSRGKIAGSALVLALAIGGCALAADSDSGSGTEHSPAAREEIDPNGPGGPEGDISGSATTPMPTTGPVHEATLHSPNGALTLKYKVSGEVAVAEGDMVLGPTDDNGELDSATSVGRRWPGKTIPYVIDADLPNSNRITAAVTHWEQKTGIHFVPRTTEFDFVQFRSAPGCSSNIGQYGGRQFINLTTLTQPGELGAVGIDRSSNPTRVYHYFKSGLSGGYGLVGTPTRTNAYASHFKFIVSPGKAVADLIDVAFDSAGHLFAWYADGTVSEGTYRDFSQIALAKPFVVAGHKVSDIAGLAIDASDQVHAFYKDGTSTVGSTIDLTAVSGPRPLTLPAGKDPSTLAHVDFDGTNYVAFYNNIHNGGDAGPTYVQAVEVSLGNETDLTKGMQPNQPLGRVAFTGHCETGAVIHEMGHSVGLYHEQTRNDRDEFVRIDLDNVSPEDVFNFEKHSAQQGVDTGPYDFGSVMHYGPDAFSLRPKNGCQIWQPGSADACKDTWSIIPIVDPSVFDGGNWTAQRIGLSPGDVWAVSQMYDNPPLPAPAP